VIWKKKIYEARDGAHSETGDIDLCFPGDRNKYYMALKHNNYEYILHSYKIAIRMAELRYQHQNDGHNAFILEAEKIRNDEVEHYQHLIDTFNERDDTELRKALAENEVRSLEELKRFVVKI
jgi:hypothetical protein